MKLRQSEQKFSSGMKGKLPSKPHKANLGEGRVWQVLSEQTAELVRAFFHNRADFQCIAKAKTVQELVTALEELLKLYANDKNSSTLREWAVLQIAGCQPRIGKIGYNGYREDVPFTLKVWQLKLQAIMAIL